MNCPGSQLVANTKPFTTSITMYNLNCKLIRAKNSTKF